MRRIRLILVFLGALMLSATAIAQVGNEWIDYSRPYYKIPTGQNGIYKLTYSDLVNAGVPVGAIDPSTIRIFHRGTEQAIYVNGESDHQFDATDYLEFYGKRNDGTIDASLYPDAAYQPHQYYNLYNDTTAYFLTFGGADGKRMPLFTEDPESLPAETYQLQEKRIVNSDVYFGGALYNDQIQYTYFDQGEGWTSTGILQNQVRLYNVTGIINTQPAGGKPQLEVVLQGVHSVPHQVEVMIGASNRVWKTVSFESFEIVRLSDLIEWSDINASGVLAVSIKPLNTNDRVSVPVLRLIFPQAFTASGETEKTFTLPVNAGGKSSIAIQNAAAGMRLFDITDPDNIVRIGTTTTTTLNAVVNNTHISRQIFATTTVLTPSIRPVTFININPSAYDYVLLSHPLLRKPAGGYADPVQAYADYRASTAGGGFAPLVLNIQQVYDQFSYGETTPVGIFHLMKFLTNVKVPRYFFIIGKGLEINTRYYRNPNAATFATYKNLIPSAGNPASDNFFSVGLAGTAYEPAVPTGRLSAVSSSEVAAYLNKIIETESQPFDFRKKNLLHLSGGIEEGEPERFKTYVDSFKEVAEDYYLGGNVTSIAKRSTDIKLISIAEEVNKGLGLVTFFGHSSATTLDFDIGWVSDPVMGYDNKGKYPFMLMHGCNVGSFFLASKVFGEDWVLAADKGAVGFIAHTFYGFESTLFRYGDTFYKAAYADSVLITKGIGDIMRETSRRFMDGTVPSPAYVTQAQQMMLLGDPAARLFRAEKPDLEIHEGNVSFQSFNHEPILPTTDSFKINIVVRNFGLAKPNPFRIQVERLLSDNTKIVEDTIVNPVLYSDTIEFIVRKLSRGGFGTNVFTITVDADNIIDELDESNNTASRELFVPANGTKNLFPTDLSIVDQQDVTLSWQTTDIFSDERELILELDTAASFDSPFKKVERVVAKAFARLQMELLTPQASDTVAYYWRTKLADPLPSESDDWETSSFTFIPGGPEGWAQVHFPQFEDNEFDGLVADQSLREIKLQETITPVYVKNFGTNHIATNRQVSVKIKGVEYNLFVQGFGCRDNSINFIAFDRRSTSPYIGIPFKWYNRANRACGREPWVINNFRPAEMVTGNNDDVIAYVNNIAVGDSVLIYSIGNAAYNLWPAAAKTKLGELGVSAAQLASMLPDEPVIIFGRKGSLPGTALIFQAPTTPKTAELVVNKTITGRFTSGTMTSSLIGPAASWQSFNQQISKQEALDNVEYDIVGVKLNGVEEMLFENFDGDMNLSAVSAEQYPYLKVDVSVEDFTNLTSPQVDHWIVSYTPVPEGIVTYFGPREQQSVPQGVNWTGHYGFINIGEKTFDDSLVVRYDVYSYQQAALESKTLKIKAPLPGDTTDFDIVVLTANKPGLNDIDISVNPRVVAEQYYDNNVLSLVNYLNVESDGLRPVLDVTVDNRKLIEGDFVSPNPEILITVWDENKNLFKQDPSGMKVLLTYPCDEDACEPLEINLSSPEVTWSPATADTPFRLSFKPSTLTDGYYILQVEAADAIGNPSGDEPYRIGFNVEDDPSVKIQPPYPNPFSSEVHLSIVISGKNAPEQALLQVIDINGKILQEITNSEMTVGTNQWTWDGTDRNGNILPKGVYIYKMQLVVAGKEYHQAGKIVLLR